MDGGSQVGSVGWLVDAVVFDHAVVGVALAVGAGGVELGVVDEFVVCVEEVEVGGAGGVERARGLLRLVVEVGHADGVPAEAECLGFHVFGRVLGCGRSVGADRHAGDAAGIVLQQRGEGGLHVLDERAVHGEEGDEQALALGFVVESAEDVVAAQGESGDDV